MLHQVEGQKRKGRKSKKGGKKERNVQTVAMNAWADTLQEPDYDNKQWGSSPSQTFHRYSAQLSQVFKGHNANINFVLVGACKALPVLLPSLSSHTII